MTIDRRLLLAGALAVPAVATAEQAAVRTARFPIWPGPPPGAPAVPVADAVVRRSPTGDADDIAWPHVATPTLTACFAPRPNGSAVLLIPGGGYQRVALGRAPSALARWFAARGVSAFDLLYRLPHDGWAAGADVSLQDAQRAMRLIRAGAAGWGIDPATVAAMGFSAGGHVAGRLASRAAMRTYAAVDAADAQPARPMVAGLLYPVISMDPAIAHPGSRRELLGAAPSAAATLAYSLERQLPADMPPTLLGHAADDVVVPVANSLVMFQALKAARVPAELYIIEEGGHGAPLLTADGRATLWMERFALFATRHGVPV